MRRSLATLSMLISFIVSSATGGWNEQAADKTLLLMGGGNENLAADFITQVIPRAVVNSLHVLVLPVAYASNPNEIDPAERQSNLETAETRRQEMERACSVIAPQGTLCTVSLAPVFVRADAEQFNLADYSNPGLTGVFILGGDQSIAMQVVRDTPLEKALNDLYESGVVIGGSSAGAAVQSRTMLAGYRPGYDQQNALDFGAVETGSGESGGIAFGLPNAVVDQHLFQRGRLARLLNAIALPDSPQVGIGVDAYTGLQITNYTRLHDVFGKYAVAILDAQSYHAADAVQYRGARQILSLRNVVVHLLAPGNFSYDLSQRRHSLAPLPPKIDRSFDSLALPNGAGPLILSGRLNGEIKGSAVLNRFINLSGGKKARILIVLAGFSSEDRRNEAETAYRQAFEPSSVVAFVTADPQAPFELPPGLSGLVVVGEDQSRVQPGLLLPIKEAWLRGTPLMMVEAGSAIAGAWYSAHAPNPTDEQAAEEGAERSLMNDKTNLQPGLGVLNASFEPRLLENNRWGRWFSLAYKHPKMVVFGISDDSAIELTQRGPKAIGDNPILALDLRQARLDLGNNQAFVIANGLIDVFAPMDEIHPLAADVNAAPLRLATPVLPSQTPSPQPSPTPAPTLTATASDLAPALTRPAHVTPTRTPRPTPTPFDIPQPTDRRLLQSMILLGAVSVMIVLLGVWLNKERI